MLWCIKIYVKRCSPLCQVYKPTIISNLVSKSGPTYKRQVVNPRHQTPHGQSAAKPLYNIPVENLNMTQRSPKVSIRKRSLSIIYLNVVYCRIPRGPMSKIQWNFRDRSPHIRLVGAAFGRIPAQSAARSKDLGCRGHALWPRQPRHRRRPTARGRSERWPGYMLISLEGAPVWLG